MISATPFGVVADRQPLSPDGFGRVDWSCLEALAPAG